MSEALSRSSLVPARIVPDHVHVGGVPSVVVELPSTVPVQSPPGCDAATIQAVLQAHHRRVLEKPLRVFILATPSKCAEPRTQSPR